jgi:hypothetical protein
MKTKIFAALAALAFGAAGCITTVSDTNVAGNPIGRDAVSGGYQRSLDDVYAAAVKVINTDGTLLTEYIPHDTTNTVRAFKGRVSDNTVWMRVMAVTVEPPVTELTVEARTKWGNEDLDMAHELEKEVALQLAR